MDDAQLQLVELTILMPCLNEAETLAVCIQKARSFLERTGIKDEIVIADKGSTDGSQGIAEELGARVVPIPARGYGAALIGGIRAARGRYVIMGDSDDSYDFSALDDFVAELRNGWQLVTGNRFHGGVKPGAMPPLHRYLGNPVLTATGRILYGSPSGDFHCGLRGFDRNAILSLGLNLPGMEFASEMVVKPPSRSCALLKFPPRCPRMAALARRICAAGGMAGATCASCTPGMSDHLGDAVARRTAIIPLARDCMACLAQSGQRRADAVLLPAGGRHQIRDRSASLAPKSPGR